MSQAINTLNTISTQMQNLINLYIVKFINTGDRVVDGAITVIFNSMLALVGAVIYKSILDISNWLYNYHITKETDSPTDIDHSRFDYSKYKTDAILNYPFVVKSTLIGSYMTNGQLEDWCLSVYKNVHSYKQLTYNLNYSRGSNTDLLTSTTLSSNYYMPIWKYKNVKKEWEYIWIFESNVYANNFEQLNLFSCAIKQWINDRNANTPTSTSKYQPIIHEIPQTGKINLDVGKINTSRTFDNIYFDYKPQIINMLNKLKTKTLYPKGLSLDNKLGILLYGPPGTGKTGTISAIANYLQRDVMVVKAFNKTTLESLHSMGKPNSKNNYSNTIIVFDEFDHILCQKPAYAETTTQYKIRQLRESLIEAADEEAKKSILEDIKKVKTESETTGDFNMLDFLTFLDGLSDATNRVIIATTNHPDKIDKTILRPGRFDLKLELGYCSMQMFKDIVGIKYAADVAELSTPATTIDICNEKNGEHIEITQSSLLQTRVGDILCKNITPLVLINTLVQTTDFNDLLTQLDALPA